MTRGLIARLLLGAFLVLSPALPVSADSSPEAEEWLEKLLTVFDQGAFKVGYEARLDMSSLGQPLSGTLTGSFTQADPTHSRMQLSIDLPAPPDMPEGGMSLAILSVTDGTYVWTEMDSPAAGGKQVTRISLADAGEPDPPAGAALSPASFDPVAQLEGLAQTMDFEVVERAGGKVTLRGAITEATRARLEVLAMPGVDAFLFVIDEQTGFPTEVRADGETPFITMSFSDLELVEAAALPAELFEYTPPEGVTVIE